MPDRPFSLWDHHTRRTAGQPSSLRSELLDRTASFARFPTFDRQQRARLEVEYWRRIQYWTDTCTAAARRAAWLNAGLAAAGLVSAGIILWVALIQDGWPMLLFPLAAAALAWAPWTRTRRLRRLQHALATKSCPDCGCALSGTVAAIDPDEFSGHFVGPRNCPRCDAPWPLLPAALPGTEFSPPPDDAANSDAMPGA